MAMDPLGLAAPASRTPDFELLPVAVAPSVDPIDASGDAAEVLQSVELTVTGRSIFQRHVGAVPTSVGRRVPETADLSALADMGPERYAIQDEIARGSMGRVMLAFDRVLER